MDPLTLGLGLGGMALGFLGGKGKGQRTSLDPETQNYIRWLRQLTQGDSMNLALRALGGDADALARMSGGTREFMRHIFERQRNQSAMRANEMATQAGGYGGSRSAVYNAVLDRDINEAEQGMEYQAGQDSLARALQLLGIGQGYAGIASTPLYQDNPGQERNPWLGAAGGLMSGLGMGQQLSTPAASVAMPDVDMSGFDPWQVPGFDPSSIGMPSLMPQFNPKFSGQPAWLSARGPNQYGFDAGGGYGGPRWSWGDGW